MDDHVTLLRPDVRDPEARGIAWTLPPDLLGQSAARLRILALLYALAFFLAGSPPNAAGPGGSGSALRELHSMGPNGHRDRHRVAGATAWTQDRARDWWATHQPVLTS
jgi:hypothetical protein